MFAIGDKEWPGMSKATEEAGEFIQVVGKLMGSRGEINHWSGNLRDKLHEEMGDLYAALDFITRHCDVNIGEIEKQRAKKTARFERWHTNETLPPGHYPAEYICSCTTPPGGDDSGACEECLKRGYR